MPSIFILPSRAPTGRTRKYIATPAGVRPPYTAFKLEGTKFTDAEAYCGGEPRHGADRAEVPEGQRADIVLRRWGNRWKNKLRGVLPHVLGATEEGVRSVKVDRTLQHDAARERPRPNLVVRAVNQAARPR